MKVLSLFDGIGGAWLACQSAGINVSSYHSSEVDKNCISFTSRKVDTYIQLGDVRNVSGGDYDLILAGSPCQGFSYAGKGLNFKDPRSSLFFEFLRILNETKAINSNVKFILENVKMRSEWENVISECLEEEPFNLCASCITPFRRNRNYWFNWKNPKPINDTVGGFNKLTGGKPASIVGRKITHEGKRSDKSDIPLIQCIEVAKGDIGRCVTTVEKDSCVYLGDSYHNRVSDAYGVNKDLWRKLTIPELEKGHGYPDSYFTNLKESFVRKAIGNGWSIPVVSYILKAM